MTVEELLGILERIPKDAEIKLDIQLIGDEHPLCRVSYDGKSEILYLSDCEW